MIKNSTQPVLLQKLSELLASHRAGLWARANVLASGGDGVRGDLQFWETYRDASLAGLGITDGDWSGWYRLFSHRRYTEQKAARIFFRKTVQHTAMTEPYVVAADGYKFRVAA